MIACDSYKLYNVSICLNHICIENVYSYLCCTSPPILEGHFSHVHPKPSRATRTEVQAPMTLATMHRSPKAQHTSGISLWDAGKSNDFHWLSMWCAMVCYGVLGDTIWYHGIPMLFHVFSGDGPNWTCMTSITTNCFGGLASAAYWSIAHVFSFRLGFLRICAFSHACLFSAMPRWSGDRSS